MRTDEWLKELDVRDLRAMEKLVQVLDTRIDFATNSHVNVRGEKMDFVHYPHIRALYQSLAREIVLQGSVQSFKSEFAIIDHFSMAYNNLSVFYVLPKFETRNTYVANRINRCVERVPRYKKLVSEGFSDSVALKSFGGGVVKYVGSNVLADFVEFPGDVLYVDEVDECDQDNIRYALDRLKASPYQFKRYLGNPRQKDEGINKLFNKSDQREWFVPCKKCKEFSELNWFHSVVKEITDKDGNVVSYVLRDTAWEPGCGRDIFIVCPSCGGELQRDSFDGQWRPANPESSIEGYHISMLCSPINSVAGMWADFNIGLIDPAEMQRFYNSALGLPFSASGSKVTAEVLRRSVETGFLFENHGDRSHIQGGRHSGPCTMGVDVGGNLDVRISAIEGHKRRAVFMGKVKRIDELYELIRDYNVERAVIDSMPEVTLAQDFQELAACEVWLCHYRGEGTDRRKTYDTIGRMINVDRTECLDRSFSAIRRGRNILPENFEGILGGQYVKEMCGPVREVTKDSKGNSKYEWTACVDHQRHADSYDLLAAQMFMDSEIGEVYVG